MRSAVVLTDPKTPFNVGSALRAASIFGAREMRWTGERVIDPNAAVRGAGSAYRRLPREERMKEYRNVQWGAEDGALDRMVEEGLTPVAVEIRPGSESLVDFVHPEDAVYVFGPEDGSLGRSTLAVCHRFVRIPAYSCLNLAAAVSVVLYDRVAKLGLPVRDPVAMPAGLTC